MRRLVALCVCLATSARADQQDMDYQRWAAKINRDKPLNKNDPVTQEQLKKGKEVACGFCNLHLRTLMDRYKRWKKGELKGDMKEEDNRIILELLCEHVAPGMAREMNLRGEDATMNCKRVAKENQNDMMDALSMDEDMDGFCRDEAKLCDMSHSHMLYVTQKLAEVRRPPSAAAPASNSHRSSLPPAGPGRTDQARAGRQANQRGNVSASREAGTDPPRQSIVQCQRKILQQCPDGTAGRTAGAWPLGSVRVARSAPIFMSTVTPQMCLDCGLCRAKLFVSQHSRKSTRNDPIL
jgi:hypothetical protein